MLCTFYINKPKLTWNWIELLWLFYFERNCRYFTSSVNLLCILILISLLLLVLFHCFVSGQSIDITGSYTSAIWAFIGMYSVSALFVAMSPVYQRFFASHRLVTFEIYRQKKEARKKNKTTSKKSSKSKNTSESNAIMCESVTSVWCIQTESPLLQSLATSDSAGYNMARIKASTCKYKRNVLTL